MIQGQKSSYLSTIFAIITIFLPYHFYGQSFTVSGIIKEARTKENIPYVNVSIESTQLGVSANAFGFYSIQVPSNTVINLRFSAIGYQVLVREVLAQENLLLNIELVSKTFQLNEIVIESRDENYLNGNRPISLPIQSIKDIPARRKGPYQSNPIDARHTKSN